MDNSVLIERGAPMRGETDPQCSMFRYVDLESRISKGHPIRKIRRIVDEALLQLEPALDEMYSDRGRPSIPPEQLLRALLLQILFSVRMARTSTVKSAATRRMYQAQTQRR